MRESGKRDERDGQRERGRERDRVCGVLLPPSIPLALSLLLFLPGAGALSLSVAPRHELTYSLERSVCVLTRPACVMGARWSPPLWYRISMPIRRAGCAVAAATATATSEQGSSVATVAAAAAVAATVAKGLSSVSWTTSEVLGRDHGAVAILILIPFLILIRGSRLPVTRRCGWWSWRWLSSASSSSSSCSSRRVPSGDWSAE